MEILGIKDSTRLTLDTGLAKLGRLELWAPEAIVTEEGFCAVYPTGCWTGSGAALRQSVPVSQCVGPGNFQRIGAAAFECCGIRIRDCGPVAWETEIKLEKGRVRLAIRLTNLSGAPLKKLGAAICLKFLNASWWSDETTFAVIGGRLEALSTLGRDAGWPNLFQAYLVEGQSYENAFYQQLWGFNRRHVDRPALFSECRATSRRVGIEADRAYFVMSNGGNPCTDLMLAFGDAESGQKVEAHAAVWVEQTPACAMTAR